MTIGRFNITICLCILSTICCLGQGEKEVYTNPILFSDYSDPDVVRVGEDYYMTASSFNCVPGLPILHSTDLANWSLVNYAIPRLSPDSTFSIPQHGNGVWAPCIRYHDGWFYIFYGDPDFGIFMTKSKKPKEDWTIPHLVHQAKGWIDPSPYWDEDGKAYLVHAFAGSRASIKSILVMHEMAPDGSALLTDGVMVFDGAKKHPTIEGPKLYKKGDYYYIFAPSGGVTYGWQDVLRSKDIYGPYEVKKVMHTGDTDINGPHQGGWVQSSEGDYWFYHFQDKGPWGRIVHVQPMKWNNGWPLIGIDTDGDGIGEPVTENKFPNANKESISSPFNRDNFDSTTLSPEWQWHANPKEEWAFIYGGMSQLRLYAVEQDPSVENLWNAGNLLLQKFQGPAFTATTLFTFHPARKKSPDEKVGLLIMGLDYSYVALSNEDGRLSLEQVICNDAEQGTGEKVISSLPFDSYRAYLRVSVNEAAKCQFSYSVDGQSYTLFGKPFQAKRGKWIGAKVGIFSTRQGKTNDAGYTDVDYFEMASYKKKQ